MNFLEEQEVCRNGQGLRLNHPRPPLLKTLPRAETLDETRLYRKRGVPPSANGSFGGLGRKVLQRQNSIPVNFKIEGRGSNGPLSGHLSASSEQQRRASPVVATQKLLAAKKRKQELLQQNLRKTERQNCFGRLKNFAIVCISTLLILAISSLLFVSLLVIDPILVGLNAQFRGHPGICRTTKAKNTTGPGNCIMPSCREGCTADLYVCTFLYVTYFESLDLNFTLVQSYYKQEIDDWNANVTWPEFGRIIPAFSKNNSYQYFNTSTKNVSASLLVNSNGCGYPPEVNCSDFYYRFSRIGTTFPCFYSDSYLSEKFGVAVPFYDRGQEMSSLGFYGGISLGAVIVLCLILLLLTKIKIKVKVHVPGDDEEEDSVTFDNGRSKSGTRNLVPSTNFTTDDSERLIDKPSSSKMDDEGRDDKAEVRNGHGPKKKLGMTSLPPSSISLVEKTDLLIVRTQEVQQPLTSLDIFHNEGKVTEF